VTALGPTNTPRYDGVVMITFERLTKPYRGDLLGLTLRLIGYLTGYSGRERVIHPS